MTDLVVRMLASEISHMPLHYVWRDSGVTQKHGFDLIVHVSNVELDDQDFITMPERTPKLLAGEYQFLSGLHHEPYKYRARGDKRLVYLAQAQNDWDDRVITSPSISSAADLEGERLILTSRAPCVFGNLRHSLELAGADPDRIEFTDVGGERAKMCRLAVEAVADGAAAAASVDPPFDHVAEKMGLRCLELPSVPVIHNATICANRDWVRANEETTLSFLRSMVDAIHYFKTEKSRVCEILERTLAPIIGLEGPDEVEHLHAAWASLLSPKPFPHPIAVWNVYNLDVAHDPNVNFVGPFETWDTSYLRSIDDSGYIDNLGGSAKEAANPAVHAAI